MIFAVVSTLICLASLAVCGATVYKVVEELSDANERLYAESQNNAERADFWAKTASQTDKDLMSVMEDNADTQHTNLELSYKLARMERNLDNKIEQLERKGK